ncbi:MAG: DEAD/DEAH box helicase [Verrucomicrobiota bacterium]
MNGWTEETIRGAASWQAFKEGRELWKNGAVTAAAQAGSGWTGTVVSGGRPRKVRVVVRSATDISTACGCPENRATGALCGHAVAAGLAALSPAVPSVPAEKSHAQPVPHEARPRLIVLPPDWSSALQRGKLAVALLSSQREEISAADGAFSRWLDAKRVPAKAPQLLLSAEDLPGFLRSLVGHPEIVAGKARQPVEISDGARIPMGDAAPDGAELVFQPQPDAAWCLLGGDAWNLRENSLQRAGSRPLPADLADLLDKSLGGCAARVFLRTVLASLADWQEWVEFPESGWIDSLHFIPAKASIQLEISGSLASAEAKISIRYPDATPVAPGIGKIATLPELSGSHCSVRNFAAEESAVGRLTAAGWQFSDPASGTFTLRGEDAVIRFLAGQRDRLAADGWEISEHPRFRQQAASIRVIHPDLRIVGEGNDWLDFELKFQTSDGAVIPASDVRAMLASSGRSGQRLVLAEESAGLIEPLFSDLDLRQENGRFRADQRSAEVIKEIRNKFDKKHGTSGEELFEILPSLLAVELRHYQARGFSWLVNRLEKFGGALLADDMGLGKTIQTIAAIEHLFGSTEDGVVLVVATTSLLGNWKNEWRKFAPARRVRILHGGGRDSERGRISAGDVVITSYGTLARDLAWHLGREYRAVVADEASLMRNPDTDHARALSKLRARGKIALTGTPLENGVRDLWSIFRFIQPGWLGSKQHFGELYEAPLREGGGRAVMERLRLKISPFILRRTKEQVAPELPGKIIIDEFCELSREQRAVYGKLLEEGRKRVETLGDAGQVGAARMQVLTALLRLRQASCDLALLGNDRLKELPLAQRSGKLERLLELLDEALSGNHKILVFSQFQKQLLEIEKILDGRGVRSLRLDGSTSNRQKVVDEFQSPDGPPVFLISLKAGGYGLNLTAADTVIHFDPWWNPAAEAQATDRAHRIGQTRPVTVYRLLTRGTVEEKVVRMQEKKRELAAVIDEDGGGDAKWSIEELKRVFE